MPKILFSLKLLLSYLSPVKQLNLDVSELPDVAHVVRPVLAAFDHAAHPGVAGLHAGCQHHDHAHPVLPDHGPEGGSGVWPRALGRDVHPGALGEHVLHERSVDVVAGLRVPRDLVAGDDGNPVIVIGDDVLIPAGKVSTLLTGEMCR